MSIKLRTYQKAAAEKIVSAYNENSNRIATVCVSPGFGVSTILIEAINAVLNSNPDAKVLCLFKYKAETYQFREMMRDSGNIHVCTTPDYYVNQSVLAITYKAYSVNIAKLDEIKSDLIICRNAEVCDSQNDTQIHSEKSKLMLGVFDNQNRDENNLFYNAPCLFEICNYNFSEIRFLEQFAVPMLEYIGFTKIETDKKCVIGHEMVCPDIVAHKNDVRYFIEIKTYRGMFNDRQVVRYAINNIINYRNILRIQYPNSKFGLILMCDIDESTKLEIAKDYGIFVWDIKNLLYLCRENIKLSAMLEQISYYSLNGIKQEKPIEVNYSVKPELPAIIENKYETELIGKLNNCKPGNSDKADKAYEEICAKILKYLFENEFSQFSEQHTTKDAMFRMDIICGLKGTVEFWKFLIKYYNTKFVVFECKNYKYKLGQNLIYVTDKYLFNPVLRNVAFIISRKGFNDNAQKAALGILKEQGKLILDITDSDLEKMIKAKSEGKEPSDFLLDKVERLLMGVSI